MLRVERIDSPGYHLSRHSFAKVWFIILSYFFPPGYPDLTKFLMEDQGMGIYLYSQLLSGKSTNQMELAEQCFNVTCNDMDAETRKVG